MSKDKRTYRGTVEKVSKNRILVTFDQDYLTSKNLPSIKGVKIEYTKLYSNKKEKDGYHHLSKPPQIGDQVRISHSRLEKALKIQKKQNLETGVLDEDTIAEIRKEANELVS